MGTPTPGSMSLTTRCAWRVIGGLALALCLLAVVVAPAMAQEEPAPVEPGAEPAAGTPPEAAARPAPAPAYPNFLLRFYINPLWLFLFVLATALWLWAISWASDDATGLSIDHHYVAAALLASGLPGTLLALLLHAAFSFVTMACVAGVFAGYVMRRNQEVPEMHRFLGRYHRARIIARVPILNRFASGEAGLDVSVFAVPFTNAQGRTLEQLSAERQDLAAAAVVITDTLVRACTLECRGVHIRPQNDQYVTQFILDGVLHNIEAHTLDSARDMVACVAAHLGLQKGGRTRKGSGTLTTELPAHGEVKVNARVDVAQGKPALSFALPEWTRDIHKRGPAGLGMHEAIIKRVKAALGQETGAIVICGPPDSGKTATLRAIGGEIDFFTNDIFLIEKKPEGDVPHVRRWTIPQEGSFKKFHESVLREAPNVLLFSELETPEQVQCALSFAVEHGRTVASLAARSAPHGLLRLTRAAADVSLVTRSVTCVLSQQLVRMLCTECRQPVEPNPNLLARLRISPDDPGTWYRPGGCDSCLGTGYHGRTAIFAMLILTDPVMRVLAKEDATAADIRTAAGTLALRTLYQDGISKVTGGITTMEEVRRVLKNE